jgi:hypothetical protein
MDLGTGFRRRVGMITGRFWVPFDQRFSLVLRRLKTHAALFESSLDFVFSEEMLQHFTTMEQEMKENAAHREDDKYNQKLAETKAKG